MVQYRVQLSVVLKESLIKKMCLSAPIYLLVSTIAEGHEIK